MTRFSTADLFGRTIVELGREGQYVIVQKPEQGWQCPGCGACYAPTVQECQRCKPKEKWSTGD